MKHTWKEYQAYTEKLIAEKDEIVKRFWTDDFNKTSAELHAISEKIDIATAVTEHALSIHIASRGMNGEDEELDKIPTAEEIQMIDSAIGAE